MLVEIAKLKSLELRKPIPVKVWNEGDDVLASWEAANVNGSGETICDALDCLADFIDSSYRTSVEYESQLSPYLAECFAVMREYITP